MEFVRRFGRIDGLTFLFCFLFFAFQGTQVLAQSDTIREGTLTIHADSRLDSLISINKRNNEEKQTIAGYRVQLFFGTERKKATDIKSDFLQRYPEIPAYVIYQQPNYKVRVGDFRTRLEAYRLYQLLNAEFPSSFVVKDEIVFPVKE